MPDTDPSALVRAIRDRNEAEILRLRLADWQLGQMPHGDLRRTAGALEAVLKAASRWQENSAGYDARALCAGEVRRIIGDELGGEGGDG
jgi:hypothetical protein